MAGLSALGGHEEGRWYVCDDGWPLELLDSLHLLFPNEGRRVSPAKNYTGRIPCFEPRHFPFVRSLPNEFLPGDLVDSAVVFLLLCAIVTITLVVTKFIWSAFDPRFASIRPTHKQWYVVANVSKAFLLGSMSLSVRCWIMLYHAFFKDQFPSLEVKRSMLLYSITDVVALYMVPKLPTSTIIHHIVVPTFCLVISTIDLSVPGWGGLLGVCKMAVLYGTCGTVAFTVNAYLALRVVYPKAQWLHTLAKLALVAYLLGCAANWTVHLLWLGGIVWRLDASVWTVLYLLMVLLIVHDDITLIKWLVKRSSPMADEHNKME